MKKENSSPVGIGAVTIIMILLVLCLVTFSSLALFTAKSDLYLSNVNANSIAEYYAAEATAVLMSAEFAKGNQSQLLENIKINENMKLNIHLVRDGDNIKTLKWQTVVTKEAQEDKDLNIWNGNLLID